MHKSSTFNIIGFFILVIFLINSGYAIDIQLLCLEAGESVQFSKCNPVMQDRTCSSSQTCQYCVTYNEQNGVYCPANINICNAQPGLSCSSLISTNNSNQNNSAIDNNSTNNPPQNNSSLKNAKADIAYVVKNELGVDNYLLAEFQNNGYSYEIIYESKIAETDFDFYYIIIVGNQRLDNPGNIPIDKHKSIIINSYNYYKKNLDWQLGWSGSTSSISSPGLLTVFDSSHPIVSGLSRSFRAYSVTDPNIKASILKGEKPRGVYIVAYSGIVSNSVLAAIERGTTYLNGRIAKERGVFFGITNARYWTTETKTLFKNSLSWLIEGADIDGDGFLSDNDCNDRDPKINPAARDPALDCINEPPIIDNIPRLTFSKGDLVVIPVTARDPDNDVLSYKIDDSRFSFSSIDKTFVWQTSLNDAGQYTLKATVSDGQSSTSQDFTVNIKDSLFKFNQIPNVTWEEDSFTVLNLNDYLFNPEADEITFGIAETSSNNDISAETLSNGVLKFVSTHDWFGEDWIIFSASDRIDKVVSNKVILKVTPLSDSPIIKNSNPDDLVIKLPEGIEKVFKLDAEDPDKENFTISWRLNNIIEGNGGSYKFKKPRGVYTLQAIISDSLYQIDKFWSIIVGDSQEFTCSEINGFICSEDKVCPNSNNVSSLDSPNCCLVECISKPAQFKDVDVCDEINNSLKIEIESPRSDDSIKVGDTINPEIKVESELNEDLDLDVEVSLYNIDEEESIVEDKGSVEIVEGRREVIRLELDVPANLDLDDDYVLFVKAEDGLCNQKTVDIDIERAKDKIEVTEFNLPERAKCGDTITSRIKIENLGSNDQEIFLNVRNNKLNIDENTGFFEIEDFNGDNSVTKQFSWTLPEKIDSGEYILTATIKGTLLNLAETRKIDIECEGKKAKEESKDIESIGPIKLDNLETNQQSKQNKENKYNVFILSIMLLTTFVGIAFLFLCYYIAREKE